MAFGNLTVNQGTNQGILVDQAGTSDIGVVKIDLASSGTYGTLWGGNVGVSSGTINTLGTLPNLPGGSIAVTAGTGIVTSGSIAMIAGTINTGTFSLTPLSGVVLTTAVTLGTLGTLLPATALSNRKSLICYNSGTLNAWLGGTGVGTSGGSVGLPLVIGDYSPSFDLGTTTLYGITTGTTGGTITVLEVS